MERRVERRVERGTEGNTYSNAEDRYTKNFPLVTMATFKKKIVLPILFLFLETFPSLIRYHAYTSEGCSTC